MASFLRHNPTRSVDWLCKIYPPLLVAPLDFTNSTRDSNPVDGAFVSHITTVLNVGSKTRTPYKKVASSTSHIFCLYHHETAPIRWATQ